MGGELKPVATPLTRARILSKIQTRSAKTAAYTVVAADRGAIIDCTTGTFSLTLTAAATLGAGFVFGVYNSGSGVITIDPNAAETVRTPNGAAATTTLAQGQGMMLMCDGANWDAVGMTPPQRLTGSASLDFASIAVNSYADLTITVTGATVGSVVSLGAPATIPANVHFFAWVSAADTVTVRCVNNDAVSAADPAAGTYRVTVETF